jgi:hypothetical protein
MGAASYSCKHYFCPFDGLLKSNIQNINVNTWPERSREELKRAAKRYRDTTTKAERKRIFRETGVRWSVVWKLEYWNPTRMVAVDGMHALFLGLVLWHFTNVLGINETENKKRRTPEIVQALRKERKSSKELAKARKALQEEDLAALKKCSMSALQILAEEQKLMNVSSMIKKKDLISRLFVSDVQNIYSEIYKNLFGREGTLMSKKPFQTRQ